MTRNYFMANLHESIGPGRDLTRNPGSAVSQTRYRLGYTVRYEKLVLFAQANSEGSDELAQMSRDMRFPTMWHFDMCRLRRASAATF